MLWIIIIMKELVGGGVEILMLQILDKIFLKIEIL